MRQPFVTGMLLVLLIVVPGAGAEDIPEPPPGTRSEYGFAELDESTMEKLLDQGAMIVVRQNEDMTLVNVTAGQLVDAPLDTVWEVVTDFENYPEFMPQTSKQVVKKRHADDLIVVEQTIDVKIWRLPSVGITYQLAQELTPKRRVRFWHIDGDLYGTYGGWDLVSAGDKTMAFYTLYSNLTALGWGLGSIFESQPDFMAGVNVTTAMMVAKAVKEEAERRAAK